MQLDLPVLFSKSLEVKSDAKKTSLNSPEVEGLEAKKIEPLKKRRETTKLGNQSFSGIQPFNLFFASSDETLVDVVRP